MSLQLRMPDVVPYKHSLCCKRYGQRIGTMLKSNEDLCFAGRQSYSTCLAVSHNTVSGLFEEHSARLPGRTMTFRSLWRAEPP